MSYTKNKITDQLKQIFKEEKWIVDHFTGYSIGWDTENYLTDGVRYCAIFVKLTESLNDALLVQYTNGTKRRVAGMYLFTDKEQALAWVEEKKLSELNAVDNQIYQLQIAKEKIYQIYSGIIFEDKVALIT